MTDQNRGNTGTGAAGGGSVSGTDTVGLAGGSAGTSGRSDAGIGAAGGTTAVKSTPAKRGATKASGTRASTTSRGRKAATGGGAKAQIREASAKVKETASGKAREYALKGKDQATAKLDEVVRFVNDAAEQVEEKLGPQYAGYARSAAEAVAGFSSTLRQKDVDELLDDARAFVRKSPAVAIGAAAAVGFVLARLVKAGIDAAGPDVDGDQGPGRPTSSL